ncbi:MAG: glycosyltransferase family 4 protein [bacterium]
MPDRQIIGVMGGSMLGADPMAERSWSGSSRFFFRECARAGILRRTIGVEAPRERRLAILLKNFSPSTERWRQKFWLDVEYYGTLTREIVRRIREGDDGCDVLQIGGIYDVPALLKDGRNGRRCFSYHDGNILEAVRSPFMMRGIPQRKIHRAIAYERNVCQGMDAVFTMSEYLRRSFIEDFGIAPDRVHCIGGGINLETIPPEVEKEHDRKAVLFVGVRFQRKGGLQLLEAFRAVRARIPDAKLHIVGPRHLNIPAKYSEGVVRHGYLSKAVPEQRAAFEKILKEACLFVMPSLYEPFGISPLEAMVNQIPCILTHDWAFPEMVRPGVNGDLVERGNTEDLAGAMVRYLRSPEKLAEMGRAARAVVLEKFTWEKVVGRLLAELAARGRG